MKIRKASNSDSDYIRTVHLAAFPEEERELVSQLAANLLLEETIPQTIALVAEVDDDVVGHVAFSPVAIDSVPTMRGYILAPLGVMPGYQKHSIGSELVEHGIQQLSDRGSDILFVYGDPEYYGRFGFSAETAEGYTPPYPLQYPIGWQGVLLKDTGNEKSPAKITCVESLCDPILW